MKILEESASSQTLKIIPKSYPTLVDVVVTDEEANTPLTIENVVSVTNGGYLDIDSVYALKEGKFYSFEVWDKVANPIVRNSDYYIQVQFEVSNASGMTINGINFRANSKTNHPLFEILNYDLTYQINSDMEVDLQSLVDISGTSANGPYIDNSLTPSISLNDGDIFKLKFYPYNAVTNISQANSGFFIGNSAGVLFTVNADVNATPTTVMTWDIDPDISIFTMDLSAINEVYLKSTDLTFSQNESGNGGIWNGIPYIGNSQNNSIFKGKIFCTNQDNYSINNGQYIEQSKDNKYVIYE